MAFSCVIVIGLYLQYELTFDQHNEHKDSVYRIASQYDSPTSTVRFLVTSPNLGPRLAEEYPEIEAFARINNQMPEMLLTHEDVSFYENDLVYGDQSIFDLLTFQPIYGAFENALTDMHSIVLSESMAVKYFGDEDPVGKQLLFENQFPLQVTAVFADLPANVHIPMEAIISLELRNSFLDLDEWHLYEIIDITFVKFIDGYDLADFWSKWDAFYAKHAAEDGKAYNQEFIPLFSRLSEMHYTDIDLRGDYPTANRTYHLMFGFIGVFIWLISCINYINMTTARAVERYKEMMVKKVCGSSNLLLIGQLLFEAFVITFISAGLSLILVEFLLTFTGFNTLTGIPLVIDLAGNILLQVAVFVALLVTTLVAGTFPAWYGVRLSQTARENIKTKTGFRDALVVIQFTVAIAVINLMLLMNKQVGHIESMDLGFNKTDIISIDVRDTVVSNQLETLKARWLEHPGILSASSAYHLPSTYATGLYQLEKDDGYRDINYHVYFVYHGYLETLGLELVSGRDFDRENPADIQNAVIVNEALVRDMGWDDPIGKEIKQGSFESRVVGVVKDFHFQSLHQTLKPLILRMISPNGGNVILQLSRDQQSEAIAYLKSEWNEINPSRPLIYSYLSDSLDAMYQTDRAQIKLIQLFSMVSVLISCLGLLGLTSFTALRKTKEVGIRKVLGASVMGIVTFMFRNIFLLILVAFVLASFVSYFAMERWLTNFVQRTEINGWLYLLTGGIAVGLAWITVSYQFLKVAKKNPVEALRYE